jgi:hypothetical protein
LEEAEAEAQAVALSRPSQVESAAVAEVAEASSFHRYQSRQWSAEMQ